MDKTNLAIVFGGKSGEYEVSLVSSSAVIDAVDTDKYNVIELGITENGSWLIGQNCLKKFKEKDYSDLRAVSLSMDSNFRGLNIKGSDERLNVDLFFPVLHGPYGEDGTIQGMFEMANIPYVGCGVLASSTCMDKIQCKAILNAYGIPTVPSVAFNRETFNKDPNLILKQIEDEIGLPAFIKPANMGSSVGINKAKTNEGVINAINIAFNYDRKILVEKALRARELECAILGNYDPIALAVGEVIVGGEFYDFNDKYVDGKSYTVVPAEIDSKITEKVKLLSLEAYKALDCSGLSRVDTFLDLDTGEIFMNEINTLPGFTSISMYPKMAEHYGLSYPELVEELIAYAFSRHAEKQKNQIVYESGSDWFRK
ncbi:D-alanine--D-alanine ligase [Candidatus Peregrinibacteria bacterium]|nr:D-alanine--D-alanine ligase [Candidatus Peregrinibacteria bacterium]